MDTAPYLGHSTKCMESIVRVCVCARTCVFMCGRVCVHVCVTVFVCVHPMPLSMQYMCDVHIYI